MASAPSREAADAIVGLFPPPHSLGVTVAQTVSDTQTGPSPSPSASSPLEPRGPQGLPYLGCLDGLLRNPMEFWLRIATRYGPVAKVPIKRRHVYLVSDPDVLYELLVTNRKKYRKNTRYRAAVEVLGEGLLLTEGDEWKRQRLITQPTFKADYIAEQVPWMAAHVEAFLDRWERHADDGSAIDTERDFLDLSQRIAGRYLMGEGFAEIADRFCAAGVKIKNAWPLPPRSALHALFGRTAGWTAAMEGAVREIDACVYEYLEKQRKRDFANCGVLEVLVKSSREQGDEFDDTSLRSQLLTLFFAGHETSSTSLAWIFYLLDRHPEVRTRVAAESVRIVGDRLPSAADVEALTYTDQVVSESLRLYSPIHSISRVALEPDTLGGYAIPQGATIYVSLYAIHRLEKLWPDAHRFDPDRFTPDRCAERPRFAFIPFAAGHRNCIGAAMAMSELKLVVAQITRRFELELVPGQRIEMAAGTTMHPRYGIRMRLRRIPANAQRRDEEIERQPRHLPDARSSQDHAPGNDRTDTERQ
jgi:cytochrome P450